MGKAKYPLPITNEKRLRAALQDAIELEHSTIPLYLAALYSLEDGTNEPSAEVIRSVVMEEMLHLTLAANVLNAVGGEPSINGPRFVPEYKGKGAKLPIISDYTDPPFRASIEKFSRDSIQTFLRIEQPEPPKQADPNDPDTIGEVYLAIENALKDLSQDNPNLFSGDPAKQVHPDTFYYGGGGKVIVVRDLDSALEALDEIVEQGEGYEVHDHLMIWDGDKRRFGQEEEVAHYYRFNEIYEGRYYQHGDTPRSGPTGEPFPVDWDRVYNMRRNPRVEDYDEGSELWHKSVEFSKCYTQLLDVLHESFNGEPDQLVKAVGLMYELKYQAVALMKIPFDDGQTAGPTFQRWPPTTSKK